MHQPVTRSPQSVPVPVCRPTTSGSNSLSVLNLLLGVWLKSTQICFPSWKSVTD